jgi:hypothetical protein
MTRSAAHDMVVSESEVASDLGFKDVHDLRRWQTDLGHQVLELKHKLSIVYGDANGFRWHGRRMVVVLERVLTFLEVLDRCGSIAVVPAELHKLMLAVRVMCGKGVDWGNTLDDWFKDVPRPSEPLPDHDYVI